MYCIKCGKQIEDYALFCRYCGTRVGEQNKVSTENPIKTTLRVPIKAPIKVESNHGLALLQDKKWMLLGAVLGLVVSLFLLGAEMFEVSYTAFFSNTESFTLFGDKGFFKFLFIVGYIVAAGGLVLPLIRDEEWTDWHFWPSVIVPVASLLVLFFTIVVVKSRMSGDELMEAVKATIKVSAKGWLFIAVSIATCVLTFKTGVEIGEMQEAEKKTKVNTPVEEPVYWCARCGVEGPFAGACPKCGSSSRIYSKTDRDRMFGEK